MDERTPVVAPQAHRRREDGVAHYGSAPGELAACLRNVGLVKRTESFAMAIRGPEAALAATLRSLVPGDVVVGGAIVSGDAWWARPEVDRMVVIAPLAARSRILRLLDFQARRTGGLRVDPTCRLAIVTLLGPRVRDLMLDAKVYGLHGDVRRTPPCLVVPVAGRPVTWLLQSDLVVTACCALEDADAVHHALEEAGRRFGLARIGLEAFARFGVLERRLRVPVLR